MNNSNQRDANQAIKVDAINKQYCISIRNMPMHTIITSEQQEHMKGQHHLLYAGTKQECMLRQQGRLV